MKKQSFFGRGRKTFRATAPGRLDVMGGIADYSGSLVLEMPIREAATVTVAPRDDGWFRVVTDHEKSSALLPDVSIRQGDLGGGYAAVRERFAAQPAIDWSLYMLGCALLLKKEEKAPIKGVDIRVESTVPSGKGVSSSAALEVATMSALCKAYRIRLGRKELPLLCQRVENLVVGAPCGLMDQLACYLGRKDRLLPILCQPDGVRAPIAIPHDLHFVGIDSGVSHAVSGASYSDVRTAAFMGYSLLAAHEGVSNTRLKKARTSGRVVDLPHGGYLANIKTPKFEADYAGLLPDEMSGRAFLKTYESIDPVTMVNVSTRYRVKTCASHPVYEHDRTRRFKRHLASLAGKRGAAREEVVRELGNLMVKAHESYNACRLGSKATDELVERALKAGPRRGVYGAKITGGGSGGTVCLLCRGSDGVESAKRIARSYSKDRKRGGYIFLASRDGAYYR